MVRDCNAPLNSNEKQNVFKIMKVYKNRKNWTDKENRVIIGLGKLRKKNKWIFASKVLKKRNSMECYNHYKSINPCLKKGRWTIKEDIMLLNLINNLGENWRIIAKIIKNRSNKQIKNRFSKFLDNKLTKNVFTKNDDVFIIKHYNSLKSFCGNEKIFKKKFRQRIKGNFNMRKMSFYEILKRLSILIFQIENKQNINIDFNTKVDI